MLHKEAWGRADYVWESPLVFASRAGQKSPGLVSHGLYGSCGGLSICSSGEYAGGGVHLELRGI